MEPELLTPRQAAEMLSIDRRTLLKYANQGRIPVAYRLKRQKDGKPGATLFTMAAVKRLKAELKQAAA